MKTAAAVILLAGFSSSAELVPQEHPFFEEDVVLEIRIYFEQEDFWDLLEENYATETYLEAEFVWEDFHLDPVGVRFRAVPATCSTHHEKSFKIDLMCSLRIRASKASIRST